MYKKRKDNEHKQGGLTVTVRNNDVNGALRRDLSRMVYFKNYENVPTLKVEEQNVEKQKLQRLVDTNVRC